MNNFYKSVEEIKAKRMNFIKDFTLEKDILIDNLVRSISDPELNSIRVHKYLTATKFVGKVETARYLDKIGLDEKTTLKSLDEENIKELLKFFELK